MIRRVVGFLVVGTSAATAAPGVLPAGAVNATLTVEADASHDAASDTVSIAPDLAVGVTSELTLQLVHSTFARTGLRGSVGAGPCVSEGCARGYDNVGLEALYAISRGRLAISALGGVHAWSFARDHHVAKLGARIKYQLGRLALVSLPSATFAITQGDAMASNRDRLWLPVVAFHPVVGGLSLGLGCGFKAPLDAVRRDHEIATGVLAQYAHSPRLGIGASWIHGKMLAGDGVMATGLDGRAVNVWVSATY
jgi:hypothetical protein